MGAFVKRTLGPPGPFPLRTWSALYRDPIRALQRLARDYGDLVLFRVGRQRVYLLNHPDLAESALITHSRQTSKQLGNRLLRRLLGDGLITSVDDAHLRQRRLLQPHFHRQHLAGFAEQMVACAQQAGARWQTGETLEVFQAMTALALAIIGKTVFTAEFDSEAGEIYQALEVILGRVHVASLVLGEMLDGWPLPMTRRTRQATERLNATLYRVIAAHRAQPNQGDMLSLLLGTGDEAGRLSDTQARDQAMGIFLAGFETMAVTLTWTWY